MQSLQLLPSTLTAVYFRSVGISTVGGRQTTNICAWTRGDVLRPKQCLALHLLRLNSWWDTYNQHNKFSSVLRPPPAKSWRRLYCHVGANPAPPSSVEWTTRQNIVTWLVAHGTNLRIRSRLRDEPGGGGAARRARLRSAWQQRRTFQPAWVRSQVICPRAYEWRSLVQDSQEHARIRGWQTYRNALLFYDLEGSISRHLQLMGIYSHSWIFWALFW